MLHSYSEVAEPAPALNIADGTVISSLHRRHRAVEFKKFLAKIDTEVPDHLDGHVIADNYGTDKSPTIVKWLAAHPRFHMHFTPTYSSWINQVERRFAYVTADLLQRGERAGAGAPDTGVIRTRPRSRRTLRCGW